MLGPGTVGAGGMSRWVPRAAVVRRHAPLCARRCRHPRPAHLFVAAAAGSLCPGCSDDGGVLSPPRTRPFSLGMPAPVVVTPGVSSPRGNSATMGVSVPSGDSTLLLTPWRDPHGFSATAEGSRPLTMTSDDSEIGRASCSRQGVGRGFELPQGTGTPRVAELPQGDKTSGVNIAGA